MPRGGRRGGARGKAYPNRTDLNTAAQPVTTAPDQPYGQAGQQANAQRVQPLPGMAAPPTGPPRAPAAPGPPAQGGGPGGGGPPGMPQMGQMPGPLHAPTQRPDEPITAGVPVGPGPGPAPVKPPDPLTLAAGVLNNLGETADPATKAMRDRVNATLKNQTAP